MVVDTIKENLCVNKLVATKKKRSYIGRRRYDCTRFKARYFKYNLYKWGLYVFTKKKFLEEKVRIDGNINTYIMYMADDSKDKVRGLTTSLDFSESIQIANCKEGMNCKLNTKLKSIEAKSN